MQGRVRTRLQWCLSRFVELQVPFVGAGRVATAGNEAPVLAQAQPQTPTTVWAHARLLLTLPFLHAE